MMDTLRALLIGLATLIGSQLPPGAGSRVLFYAPPHDTTIGRGEVDYNATGDVKFILKDIDKCYEINDDDPKRRSFAYDRPSRSLAVWITYDKSNTVLRIPVYDMDKLCDNRTAATLFEEVTDNSYEMGPFATWEDKLYFVAMRKNRHHTDGYEIRKLNIKNGLCDIRKFPIRMIDPFSVVDCSEVVGTIKPKSLDTTAFSVLDHLLVFEDQKELKFAVLTQSEYSKQTSSRLAIDLVVVSMKKRTSNVVSTEHIDSEYANWSLLSIGGLTFENEHLCWAAIDRIKCGRFVNGKLSDVKEVLQPGQATQICKVPSNENLANVMTGVALDVRSDDDMTVFFGCLGQIDQQGGAGYITVREDEVTIHKLTSDNQPVLAGSLVLADSYKKGPTYRMVEGGGGASSTSPSRGIVVMAAILIYLARLSSNSERIG